jgi:cystathionine beta-lyase
MSSLKFNSQVIHAEQTPCQVTGAIMPPIYATSTYVQPSPGEHSGYEYSRTQNPTRHAYENCLCALEKGDKAFAFASGMAAITSILELLPHQSHIIANNDLYGGTHRLFTQLKNKTANLSLTQLDLGAISSLDEYITPQTKMLWIETPSNPMLKITDIKEMSKLCQKHQILMVVDNTFASPFLQTPLELGADLVIHSATKYLGGHSDVVGGAVICKSAELSEKMAFIQNTCGAVASPFDCYLTLRSLKTLAVRMQRHCENAKIIANWLIEQPWVETVYYPGLVSCQGHDVASQQMRDFGGMISVTLNANLEKTKAFLSNCHVFALAESLGGVESLIEHPAIMTHAAIPKAERDALGINDAFIRLSVGIEDVSDLISDLQNASRYL